MIDGFTCLIVVVFWRIVHIQSNYSLHCPLYFLYLLVLHPWNWNFAADFWSHLRPEPMHMTSYSPSDWMSRWHFESLFQGNYSCFLPTLDSTQAHFQICLESLTLTSILALQMVSSLMLNLQRTVLASPHQQFPSKEHPCLFWCYLYSAFCLRLNSGFIFSWHIICLSSSTRQLLVVLPSNYQDFH